MGLLRRLTAGACLVPAVVAGAANGEDAPPQIFQELFLGDAPFPQERGEVQITVGAAHFSGEKADTFDATLGIEYGVTDRFQIEVEVPYRFHDPADTDEESSDGVGDVEVGVALAVVNNDAAALSLVLQIGLPTGGEDEELGAGAVRWEPSVTGGVAVGAGWIFGSLGGELGGGERALAYGAAFAHPLVHRLVGVIELNGQALGDETPAFLVPGVVLRGDHDMEIQLGAPVGLTRDAADWGLVARLIADF